MAALAAEAPDAKRSKDDGEALGELMYFPLWAKGLQLALIAEASGLPWTGAVPGDTEGGWKAVKATGVAPFDQLPILTTPSGLVLAQSIAIANYIGKKGNMLGSTEEEFGLGQMLMAEGEDIYTMLQKQELARWKKPEVRASTAESRVQCYAEAVPKHLTFLEKLITARGDGGNFTSSGETAGELYLFGMLLQLRTAAEPSAGDVFACAPKVKAWFEKLESHVAVRKVLDGQSAMGAHFGEATGAPYFLNDAAYEKFNAPK